MQAHQQTAQTQIARQEAQQAAIEAQMPILEAERAAAEQVHRQARAGVQRDQEDLDRLLEVKSTKEASFDPNRFLKDRGIIAEIGATLAMALGAYSAALAGGPNHAKAILDDAFHRDMQQQEAEIHAAGTAADNALARFMRQYQDMDQAKAALAIAQTHISDSMAKWVAAASTSEDTQNALQTLLAQNRVARVDAEQQFLSRAYGKRTGNVQYAMQQAGGSAASSLLQRARELEAMYQTGALPRPGADEENTTNTVEEANVEKYGKAKEKIERKKSALDRLVAAAGGQVSPAGDVSVPDDIAGHGWIAGSAPAVTEKAKAFRAEAKSAAYEIARADLPKAVGNPDAVAAVQNALLGHTPVAFKVGVESKYKALLDEERSLNATHGESVARAWEQRKAPPPIAKKAIGQAASGAEVTMPVREKVKIVRTKRSKPSEEVSED
jgi:hypothetical protein